MKLVTLKTFDSSIEAHIVRSRLESEGINSFLFDDTLLSMDPILSNALGGIKLKISDTDIDKAKQIIGEIESAKSTNENNEIIHCPNCKSDDLYSGFKSMKGMKGVLSAIFAFLFMIFPIYQKTVYRCKECSHEFKEY